MFLVAEGALVASVFMGYVVLGTIAGSQAEGEFDVYRAATRIFSWLQIGFYLLGLCSFAYFVKLIL